MIFAAAFAAAVVDRRVLADRFLSKCDVDPRVFKQPLLAVSCLSKSRRIPELWAVLRANNGGPSFCVHLVVVTCDRCLR